MVVVVVVTVVVVAFFGPDGAFFHKMTIINSNSKMRSMKIAGTPGGFPKLVESGLIGLKR